MADALAPEAAPSSNGDAPHVPADAPPWVEGLIARLDRIETSQATTEGHLSLLVDFAGTVAEQLAQAKPVVEAIAKGGIGGVLGLLRQPKG